MNLYHTFQPCGTELPALGRYKHDRLHFLDSTRFKKKIEGERRKKNQLASNHLACDDDDDEVYDDDDDELK